MIETEVKLPVDEKTICFLEKILGKAVWVRQENLVCTTATGMIRFRREGGKTILTLKGKTILGKYNQRPEIECEIPGEFFARISKFCPCETTYYEKLRASYSFGKCTVCLDKIDNKYFVEIEGKEKDITANIARLQLQGILNEKRSYTELFGRKR